MGCVEFRVLCVVSLLFLKVIFIRICGFLGRDIKYIPNIKCVSAVATGNIHLLSFVAFFVLCWELHTFYTNIFFKHFSFFKKGLHKECNRIFEININLSYSLGPLDK